MAFNYQVGSFTVPATTGNHAVVSGLSFTPKALLFFATRQSADAKATDSGGTDAAMPLTYLGMATGASNQATLRSNDDFTGGDDVYEGGNCVKSQTAGGTVNFEATLVTLDATGFTLNFTTANATAYVVNYIAFGGSDLNAKVVTFTPPTTTNATFGVTGAGFRPTGAIFIGGGDNTGGGTWGGLGFTDGTNQGANSSNFNAAIGNYQRVNQSYVEVSGAAKRFEASIVTLDADGCTLNFTTATASGSAMAVLFLNGINVHVGTFNTATASGNQTTSGVGFTPSGVIMSSAGVAAATTIGTTWIMHTIGAADGSNQGTVWASDNVHGNASLDRANVLHFLNDNATPTDMVVASLSSFGSGQFVLNYSGTPDATAREVIYVAFGQVGGGGATLSIAEVN